MPTQKSVPPSFPQQLRQLWQRWGRAFIVAVVAHALIGAVIVVLYYATRPPPPRYVVVDLLPPTTQPSPTAAPASAAE